MYIFVRRIFNASRDAFFNLKILGIFGINDGSMSKYQIISKEYGMRLGAKATVFISIFFMLTCLWAQESPDWYSIDFETKAAVKPISGMPMSSEPDSIPPDTTDMRNIISVELAKEMVPGWNVGNSLEAIGGETAWGNPLISQALMDSIKAAGFNAVRIPVAWSNFSDEAIFTIKQSWLDRVEEVVDYVLRSDMYAIINEHWDNGWIQPTYEDSEYVNNRLAVMWKQIAIHFRDYDDHLLFAGTNEVHVEDNWGAPTKENYTVQNRYNQVFVSTIRATGGRNYYRHLVVQGYVTNINYTMNYFVIPKDVVPNRLMVEVHYYDPYNFTLNESSNITQWGRWATNPSKTETWANESYADNQFNKMKTKFIDKGYAVILGEYGAIARLNLGSAELNAEHAEYRRYYNFYITHSIVSHELVPFYWDNGYTGDHGLGIFNRATGAQVYPDIVKALIDGADTTIAGIEDKEKSFLSNEFTLSQNYPNPFNLETIISYQLPRSGAVQLRVYDLLGHQVKTIVDQTQPRGYYQVRWDGTTESGEPLASGIYLYQIRVITAEQTVSHVRKMILIK